MMTRFVPAEAIPPGEYLKDELDARGWTQDDLADVTGITRRQIVNLIMGKSGITPETAIALGQALGQDPQTWMHLQVAYELAIAAKDDRDVERRAMIFGKVPVRELKRRKWIPDVDDTEALEAAVCKLLEIENISDTPQMNAAARKGAPYVRVKHLAREVQSRKYRDGGLESGIAELKKLAAYPQDARRVPKLLADLGIRLVLVQHLKGTKIDGVAMWLDDNTVPVIGLSLRYDRIDNFWFSLLHECIHLKYRDASPVDVDIAGETVCQLPEMELRANREAAEHLIAADKMGSFIARRRPTFYSRDVIRFAQVHHVHPGIVAGQLRHRGEIGHDRLTQLNAKIREHILGQARTDGWGCEPVGDAE
jgi:HTH-type transcriptional regulator / antitoxin HigA